MPSQQPRAITSSSSDQQHILKKLMSWTTLWLPTKWLSPRCWELTLECVTEEKSRKTNQDGEKMLTSRSPSSRRLWAPEMWPASRRNFSTAPTLWSRARMMSSGNLWRTATKWATTGLGPSVQKSELLIIEPDNSSDNEQLWWRSWRSRAYWSDQNRGFSSLPSSRMGFLNTCSPHRCEDPLVVILKKWKLVSSAQDKTMLYTFIMKSLQLKIENCGGGQITFEIHQWFQL